MEAVAALPALSRDLRKSASTLGVDEARFLVDSYYIIQEDRKRSDAQQKALEKSGEPKELITHFFGHFRETERQIKSVLDAYSKSQPLGAAVRRITGIGPVIGAGLLAHIKFELNGKRINTASAIWRFAGLDPTSVWGKGQKRPWNADLKTLCWKIGESFVKTSGRDSDFYGHIMMTYKETLIKKNEAGEFAEQCKEILAAKKFRENATKKHYEAGHLSPGHLHARAKRWAVKMFLSHYHHVGYKLAFGEEPPRPYVFDILGHKDIIEPPPEWWG